MLVTLYRPIEIYSSISTNQSQMSFSSDATKIFCTRSALFHGWSHASHRQPYSRAEGFTLCAQSTVWLHLPYLQHATVDSDRPTVIHRSPRRTTAGLPHTLRSSPVWKQLRVNQSTHHSGELKQLGWFKEGKKAVPGVEIIRPSPLHGRLHWKDFQIHIMWLGLFDSAI